MSANTQTHAQFASTAPHTGVPTAAGLHLHTLIHMLTTGNSHKLRDIQKLFSVLVKGGRKEILWSSEPQGFWVCVRMWVARLLWAFPPTQPPIPQPWLKGKKKESDRGVGLEAGQTVDELFSQAWAHLPLTFSH